MKQNLWDLFIWFVAVSLYLQLAIFLLTTVFFLSIRSFTLRIYSDSQRQPISIHRLVVSNYTCVVARSHVKLRTNSQHCWANNVGSCCVRVCSDLQTHAKIPNIVAQQCWELFRPCLQWCTNGCNNSQQCWDLQCMVGRIQPIRLWRPGHV